MDTKTSIVYDGIPVTIDKGAMGKVSCVRLFGIMNDEDASGIARCNAALDFGVKVFGQEQMDNIMHSLDPEGDPDCDELLRFVFGAVNAAAAEEGGDLKN